MAIAISRLPAARRQAFLIDGGAKVIFADVTFTGSYATGGEAITAGVLGVKSILNVTGNVTEASGQTTNWAVHWDATNSKLKMFGAAVGATGATEHAAAAYAASTVGHLVFWCV